MQHPFSILKSLHGIRPGGRTTVLIAAAGLVLLGIGLGYFGGVWLPLDMFSHARLHLTGMFVTLIAALIFGRFWPFSFLVGVTATVLWVSGWSPSPRVVYPQENAAAGEVPVRVVSYNIGDASGDHIALVTYLRNQQADIAILQNMRPSDRKLLEILRITYPHHTECISQAHCRLAILSKHPLSDTGFDRSEDKPGILWASATIGTSALTTIGVDLGYPWQASRQFRQIKRLAHHTLRAPGPVLVAGTFHANDTSLILLAFQEFAGLWRLTNEPTWPTWFFGLPQFAIDHIYVSGDLRPLSWPKPGTGTVSSHLPIEAVFALSPTQ